MPAPDPPPPASPGATALIRMWNDHSDDADSEASSGSERRTTRFKGAYGVYRRIRSRREVAEVLGWLESERRSDLETVRAMKVVSGFPNRRRIQIFLRFRLLRQAVIFRDQQRSASIAKELDHLQHGIAILCLRQKFGTGRPQRRTVIPLSARNGRNFHKQLPDNFVDPKAHVIASQLQANEHHKAETAQELENVQTKPDLMPSNCEDPQGSTSPISDVASKDRCLNSSQLEGPQPGGSSELHASWNSRGEAMEDEILESHSKNVEIRDLLKRRTVTACLASDFTEKLNKLLQVRLQKQQLAGRSLGGENEDLTTHSSVTPHSYQTSEHPFDREHILPQQIPQMEIINDMRNDIASIHGEIGELRKLLESFMKMSSSHQYSVQQDQSVGNTSQWKPSKKGTCSICCEMQVDSLLYRCGHMCACFKCALDLKEKNGNCPVCQAPIADVVRAYTYSD